MEEPKFNLQYNRNLDALLLETIKKMQINNFTCNEAKLFMTLLGEMVEDCCDYGEHAMLNKTYFAGYTAMVDREYRAMALRENTKHQSM